VVVDHVQDHLDPLRVQPPHHLLELPHLLAVVAGVRVPPVRREVVDGVVAPVVGQPPLFQEEVVRELVDGEELDGRYAQRLEVLDDGRVRHPRVLAAQLRRHVGVQPGEPLDVRLVDDRLVPGDARRLVAPPVERVVHHHALGDAAVVRHVVQHPVLPRLLEGVGEGVLVPRISPASARA
jgi:hypothetical protein